MSRALSREELSKRSSWITAPDCRGEACLAHDGATKATRASPLHDLGRFPGGLDRRHAAELLVVDQALDGRVVAAERALRVPPQVDPPERHVGALEDQQLADHG